MATPVGPWILKTSLPYFARALDWQVEIEGAEGRFVGTFAFRRLQLASDDGAVNIQIERLAFSPWRYALEVEQPFLYLDLGDDKVVSPIDTTAVDGPLSLPRLPRIRLTQGRLHLGVSDSIQGLADHFQIDYRPTGQGRGQLDLGIGKLALYRNGREQLSGPLQAKLETASQLVQLVHLRTDLQTLTQTIAIEADGQIDLGAKLPVVLRSRTQVQAKADTLRANANIQLEGGIDPLDLQLSVDGKTLSSPWGPSNLQLRGRLASEQMVADTLVLHILDGQLAGKAVYRPTADTLEAKLQWWGLQLDQVPSSQLKGRVEGRLSANLEPGKQRYSADLDLLVQRLDLPPIEPFDLRLLASYRPDHSLNVQVRAPPLGQLKANGWATLAGEYDLSVGGRLELEQLLHTPMAPLILRGRVHPDSARVDLEIAQWSVSDGEMGPLNLQLQLQDQRFLAASVQLEDNSLDLRADAQTRHVDTLAASIASLQLSRFLPGLEGVLQGQIDASGDLSWTAAEFSARFGLQKLGYKGWRTEQMAMRLGLKDRTVSLDIDGAGFYGRGTLRENMDFRARAVFDQAAFVHLPPDGPAADSAPVNLVLSGHLQSSGNLKRPHGIEAELNLERLALATRGWEVKNQGLMGLRYRQQRLLVDQFAVRTRLGDMALTGNIASGDLALAIDIDSLALSSLAPDLGGLGKGHITIGGSLQKPRVQSRLQFGELTLAQQPLGALQCDIELAESLAAKLDFQQMSMTSGDQPTGTLTFALKAPSALLLGPQAAYQDSVAQLAFTAGNLRLDPMLTYVLADAATGKIDLEGYILVPLSWLGEGGMDWHQLQGQVLLRQLQLEKPDFGQVELLRPSAVQLQNQYLDLEETVLGLATYKGQPASLQAAGKLFLESGANGGQLKVRLEGMPLTALDNLAAREFSLPSGVVGLEAVLDSLWTQPLLLADLNVDLKNLGWINAHLNADDTQGDLTLKWRHPHSADSLQVDASLPWELHQGALYLDRGRLQARSTALSLQPFLELVPQLDSLSGSFKLDLLAQGFGDSLQISGGMDIADLKLALLDSKPGYSFPQGRLAFAGKRGVLEGFNGSATSGEGGIQLGGFLEFDADNQPVYQVKLAAQDLPYHYDDIFMVKGLSTDLTLGSTPAGSRLKGWIRLGQSLAEAALLTSINAPPLPPPAAVQSEFMEQMEMDVFIDLGQLKVTNEVMDLTTEGAIDIYGTFYKPLLQGGVDITEGKVGAFGRQFTFQRGRILLDQLVPTASVLDLAYDPVLLNPTLDIVATTQMTEMNSGSVFAGPQTRTITLRLEGPLSGVVPRFEAEGLEESEVLALLAFGSAPSDEGADSGIKAGVYGAAKGALYSAAGQWLLTEQMGRIGLDEFQLLPSGTVQGTVGQTSMRLGKLFKLGLPVWVRYEAAADHPATGEFSAEMRLTSYLVLTGLAQSAYDRYGIGFGLNKDF